MFRVFFVNFNYFADASFASFYEAVDFAKSKSFEASIYDGSRVTAIWSPISGLRRLTNA